jgi:predicted metal-dependent enzyme (double-stranded beta helix superfamily)
MPNENLTRRAIVAGAAGLMIGRTSPAASTFDLERFVDDLRSAGAESDAQRHVEALLRRAVSTPAAVLGALGPPEAPGIHTLYRGEDVTILNVVWAPLMVLLPHDHNMWASIGIYTGREDNVFWERRGDTIIATRAASLSEKDVLGVPSDAIHSVINPIGRLTGAIHVYGGDFFAPGRSEWDADRLQQRPWNLEGARDEFRKAAARFAAAP